MMRPQGHHQQARSRSCHLGACWPCIPAVLTYAGQWPAGQTPLPRAAEASSSAPRLAGSTTINGGGIADRGEEGCPQPAQEAARRAAMLQPLHRPPTLHRLLGQAPPSALRRRGDGQEPLAADCR